MAVTEALVQQLSAPFTSPYVAGLPYVPLLDPMESPGSLFLVDPTHPYGSWPAGVPANSAALPNVFAANAAALTGVAATALTAAVWNATSGAWGTDMLLERSTKGGLHYVQPTTKTIVNGVGVRIAIPQGIYDYMRANPTHQFYVSQWLNRTKAAGTGGGVATAQVSSSTPANGYAFAFGSVPIQAGPTVVGSKNLIATQLGQYLAAEAVTAFQSVFTGDAVYDTVRSNIFNMSNAGYNVAGHAGQQGGLIFERGYIEDLTVAGRSYAEALAADTALYNQMVLTAGGDFFGDTFVTSPATVA